jgi:diacylglycerol O-acyltransferase / wax synthase
MRSSFEVLRLECPAAFSHVCRRLASRTLALEVDGDTVVLAFRPNTVEVVPALERPDLRLSTTSDAILSILSARWTLEEAVRADAIVLNGGTEDLARFHDALLDYVRGAIRCPSFPGSDDFQRALGRSRPRRRTTNPGGPAPGAARPRPAWDGPRARLSANDAAYLYRERPTAPMSAGMLAVFDPADCSGGRLTTACVIDHLQPRLDLLPRLRQRLAFVPFEAGRPVWVDDPAFDLRYHVRPAVLPAPGGGRELVELVGQVYRDPLDRARPLWELYVVEGLANGRAALVMKWHEAIGSGAELPRALFDGDGLRPAKPAPWNPSPVPSELDILRDALQQQLGLPGRATTALRSLLAQPRQARERSATVVDGLLALGGIRPLETSPLNTPVGRDRRFAMAELPWPSVRALARATGCTAGDVLLAPLGAALGKLLERHGVDSRDRTQRVLAPLSTFGDIGPFHIVDLAVGPMDERDRLVRVVAATTAARAWGQDAGIELLLRIGELAPPPWHAIASAQQRGPDLVNLVVSSMSGPLPARSLAGARHVASYPIPPVAERLALAVGFASLDGTVGVGMMADPAAVPDIDRVAHDMCAAFAALERAKPRASG